MSSQRNGGTSSVRFQKDVLDLFRSADNAADGDASFHVHFAPLIIQINRLFHVFPDMGLQSVYKFMAILYRSELFVDSDGRVVPTQPDTLGALLQLQHHNAIHPVRLG